MDPLCDNCVTGQRLSGSPKGSILTATPLTSYYGPLSTNKANKAIVIVTDIFGLSIDNPMVIADIFGEKCDADVWVPDIFNGNPIVDLKHGMELPSADIPGQELTPEQEAKKNAMLGPVRERMGQFPPEKQDPEVADFIRYIRQKYGYEKIGIVGYCWGGGIVVRITPMGDNLVDSTAAVHPSRNIQEATPKIKVPIGFFIPEGDVSWDMKFAEKIEQEWAARPDAPKHGINYYPGVTHGFGSRPNLDIPQVKAAWETLTNDLVAWFNDTL